MSDFTEIIVLILELNKHFFLPKFDLLLLLSPAMIDSVCYRIASVQGQKKVWLVNQQLLLGPGLSSGMRC